MAKKKKKTKRNKIKEEMKDAETQAKYMRNHNYN